MAAAAIAPLSPLMPLCVLGFTAFSFPLYSLAISHVNDAIPADRVVAASAALLAVYGVGTLAGPIGASLLIEAAGPGGFWILPGLAHLALALSGLALLARGRETLPTAEGASTAPPGPLRAGEAGRHSRP